MPAIFLMSQKSLQYAVIRGDGKLYNFTSQGWDALPTTGVPAAGPLDRASSGLPIQQRPRRHDERITPKRILAPG